MRKIKKYEEIKVGMWIYNKWKGKSEKIGVENYFRVSGLGCVDKSKSKTMEVDEIYGKTSISNKFENRTKEETKPYHWINKENKKRFLYDDYYILNENC